MTTYNTIYKEFQKVIDQLFYWYEIYWSTEDQHIRNQVYTIIRKLTEEKNMYMVKLNEEVYGV